MSAENGAVAAFREANSRARPDITADQLVEHGIETTARAVTMEAGQAYSIG